MRLINPMLAAVVLIAQALAFVGLGYMFADIVVLPDVLFPGRRATLAELAPYVVDTVVSYWAVFVIGALGALAALLLILKGKYQATWFLTTARVLGWVWVPLFPLGTVLGILILRARSSAIRQLSEQS